MPAQNRVTPFGEIVSCLDKGSLMGNRGELRVDAQRQLVGMSRWKPQSWIYCSTDKKFAPKPGDRPLKYTPLFFHDEYTALAAGHRPCGYCLPDRFEAFVSGWLAGNPEYVYGKYDIKRIDKVLHDERKNSDRSKKTYSEKLVNLPNGVMVTLDVASGESFLVHGGNLLKWSFGGYEDAVSLSPNTGVYVLTPQSVVNAINKGFRIEVCK